MVKGGRGASKKKAVSKSAKAGLTFPVARIGRGLRDREHPAALAPPEKQGRRLGCVDTDIRSVVAEGGATAAAAATVVAVAVAADGVEANGAANGAYNGACDGVCNGACEKALITMRVTWLIVYNDHSNMVSKLVTRI